MEGLDWRYNYTLVNGIKIPSPSPDPKSRWLPLDIFPTKRLKLVNALLLNVESDAIGGALNMVVESPPI